MWQLVLQIDRSRSNWSHKSHSRKSMRDAYVLQAAYDLYGTGYWYVMVYDETSQSYAIPITYITNSTITPGTYVPDGSMGAVMEGVCGTASQCPTGASIPNSKQFFTNPLAWSNCNPLQTSCNYNWVNWSSFSQTSGVSVPSDLTVNVVSSGSPSHITSMEWCHTGSC